MEASPNQTRSSGPLPLPAPHFKKENHIFLCLPLGCPSSACRSRYPATTSPTSPLDIGEHYPSPSHVIPLPPLSPLPYPFLVTSLVCFVSGGLRRWIRRRRANHASSGGPMTTAPPLPTRAFLPPTPAAWGTTSAALLPHCLSHHHRQSGCLPNHPSRSCRSKFPLNTKT